MVDEDKGLEVKEIQELNIDERLEFITEQIAYLEKDPKILKMLGTLDSTIKFTNAFVISDKETADKATDQIGFLRKFEKDMDNRRLEISKPINEKLKVLKNKVDKFIEKAAEARSPLSAKLNKYLDDVRIENERIMKVKQDEIRKQAEDKINDLQDHAEDKKIDLSDQVMLTVSKASLQMEVAEKDGTRAIKGKGIVFSSTQRINWKAIITNEEAFFGWCAQKPAARMHFWTLNQSACNQKAKETKKEGEANGIKFVQERTLVTR